MEHENAVDRYLRVDLVIGIVCRKDCGDSPVVAADVDTQTRAELISQGRVDDHKIVLVFKQLTACVRRAARAVLLKLIALQESADVFAESVI